MNYLINKYFLLLLIAVSSFLFFSCRTVKPPTTEVKIIGGENVKTGTYSASVFMKESECTATKIAERFFVTAAHCVTINGDLAHWSQLTISNKEDIFINREEEYSEYVPLPIKKIYRHPAWGLGYTRGPDIAIIEVSEDSPHIPVAVLNTQKVKTGDYVSIVGYGCENSFFEPLPENNRKKKVATSEVAEFESFTDKKSFIQKLLKNPEERKIVDNIYFLSHGKSAQEGSGSICPGDSGGPIFSSESSGGTLIGVNSRGLIYDEDTNKSMVIPGGNIHTRIDDNNRYLVGQWIRSIVDSNEELYPLSHLVYDDQWTISSAGKRNISVSLYRTPQKEHLKFNMTSENQTCLIKILGGVLKNSNNKSIGSLDILSGDVFRLNTSDVTQVLSISMNITSESNVYCDVFIFNE